MAYCPHFGLILCTAVGKKFQMAGITFDSIMDTLVHLRSNPLTGKNGDIYYLRDPASDQGWYVGKMDKNECTNDFDIMVVLGVYPIAFANAVVLVPQRAIYMPDISY